MKSLVLRPALVLATTVLAALPALAQFKVVGPDGRITYTDRPPVGDTAKVAAFRAGGSGEVATNASLPQDLRQVASRYPVTLYTAADCAPCDAGRQLLAQRGIPYVEKRAASDEDHHALVRITGGNTIPVLTVGSQVLRGHNPNEWANYLDAAGYPQESRLPRGWKPPAATPLVAKTEAKPPPPTTTASTRRPEDDTPVASPQGFRF